jgi:hypothetical protein
VPFQPNLSTAPHDFAVGITYLTPGGATAISDTEVDGSGNIWTVGNGSNAVYELLPTGVFNTYSPPTAPRSRTPSRRAWRSPRTPRRCMFLRVRAC